MNGVTLDSKLSTALYAHVCYFLLLGRLEFVWDSLKMLVVSHPKRTKFKSPGASYRMVWDDGRK